ncbi:sensor histidine kinase [Gulosibacter molinativorax]|uniref:histidine kinase n=2 Tax=Gulosibacter molinativorax TaxID=256821 RepID=A0ABT7CBU9_9MICO|nr:sensor histidine kinase [Gulosibacter molinativorax]QUY60982.1 Sensor histidine kinase LiaS [Gulosibacter molinativorax]
MPRWLPDALVTLLILGTPFVQAPVQEFTPANPAGWVLSLIPAAILPFRRKWPHTILVVLLAIFGAAAATGTLSPGAGVAVAVAMYHVASRTSRRRGFIIVAMVAPVIVLLGLLATKGSVFDPRVLQFGFIVAFGAAAGDGSRSRREYIAAIVERAQRAEETRDAEAKRRVSEERLRIARDLHDAVAHQIAVINLNAGVASSAIDTRPEKAKHALATIRTAGRAVLGEIGDLLSMLRSADEPPAIAPQASLDRLDDLVTQFRAVRMETTVHVDGDLARAGDATSRVAYRVIQESLTNAHKHGTEHRAHVLVEVGVDVLTVVVTNPVAPDGVEQKDPECAVNGSGFGLAGLRERVASVRGSIEAGPDAEGWKVTARLPVTKDTTV